MKLILSFNHVTLTKGMITSKWCLDITTPIHQGWKKSSRTTDHVFTLNSLINKYVYDNKKKLYTCFADFKKALDSIWHKGLFN